MTKTTSKPAARKPKAASRSTARRGVDNPRKSTPVDPGRANSPKAKVKSPKRSPVPVPTDSPATVKAAEIATQGSSAKPARTTKLMLIIGLLRRGEGAALVELMAATGWQAHSVRGALAGALRQRAFAIESNKTDGVRRYRITQADEVDQADEAMP